MIKRDMIFQGNQPTQQTTRMMRRLQATKGNLSPFPFWFSTVFSSSPLTSYFLIHPILDYIFIPLFLPPLGSNPSHPHFSSHQDSATDKKSQHLCLIIFPSSGTRHPPHLLYITNKAKTQHKWLPPHQWAIARPRRTTTHWPGNSSHSARAKACSRSPSSPPATSCSGLISSMPRSSRSPVPCVATRAGRG